MAAFARNSDLRARARSTLRALLAVVGALKSKGVAFRGEQGLRLEQHLLDCEAAVQLSSAGTSLSRLVQPAQQEKVQPGQQGSYGQKGRQWCKAAMGSGAGRLQQWYRAVTVVVGPFTGRKADSGTGPTQASRSRTDRPALAAPAWALWKDLQAH
ncbi:MAG: hypothetical protein FRX49_03930 [Trebouxia sp. A1-2]|nr:MAG: hypothetical protein FRX49_03930 [Trebouxia sp. A1-2]